MNCLRFFLALALIAVVLLVDSFYVSSASTGENLETTFETEKRGRSKVWSIVSVIAVVSPLLFFNAGKSVFFRRGSISFWINIFTVIELSSIPFGIIGLFSSWRWLSVVSLIGVGIIIAPWVLWLFYFLLWSVFGNERWNEGNSVVVTYVAWGPLMFMDSPFSFPCYSLCRAVYWMKVHWRLSLLVFILISSIFALSTVFPAIGESFVQAVNANTSSQESSVAGSSFIFALSTVFPAIGESFVQAVNAITSSQESSVAGSSFETILFFACVISTIFRGFALFVAFARLKKNRLYSLLSFMLAVSGALFGGSWSFASVVFGILSMIAAFSQMQEGQEESVIDDTYEMLTQNQTNLFFEVYSFEDPSKAYQIWDVLPEEKKVLISQTNPEAADIMKQIDKQQRLIELEVSRENIDRELRRIDEELASENMGNL